MDEECSNFCWVKVWVEELIAFLCFALISAIKGFAFAPAAAADDLTCIFGDEVGSEDLLFGLILNLVVDKTLALITCAEMIQGTLAAVEIAAIALLVTVMFVEGLNHMSNIFCKAT
jgi:hypothetical protein